MSKPQKKPSKKAPSKKPAKAAAPARSAKKAVSEVIKLSPNHPLLAQLNDPENDGRQWVVELVFPPGCFMARSIPEPVDFDAINAEIAISAEAVRTGSPVQNRYILFMPWCGAHARRVVECLTDFIPNPKLPFSLQERFDLEATFSALQ